MAVDHLYVHVPFCAHRCGYCDFVTVTGNEPLHARYVDALIAELRAGLGSQAAVTTVFVGGGTPSLLDGRAAGPPAGGPARLRGADRRVQSRDDHARPRRRRWWQGGVTRVSLGAQSFRPHLLSTLERLASPEAIRAAVPVLRDAGVAKPQPRPDVRGSGTD